MRGAAAGSLSSGACGKVIPDPEEAAKMCTPGTGHGAAASNWRNSDAPLAEKLRQSARNIWTKVRTGSLCCGRPGEPGC